MLRPEGSVDATALRRSVDSRLTTVRVVHTLVYFVVSSSTVLVLLGGVTGRFGPGYYAALAVVAVEVAVFVGHGMRCPLTTLAVRLGADDESGSGTLLPAFLARRAVPFFAAVFAIGAISSAARHILAG